MSESVFINGEVRFNDSPEEHPGEKRVSKFWYVTLAVFFGDFGVHKFYSGKIKSGVFYLLFCWTLIPEIISIFDIIRACGKLRDSEGKIWI